MWTPPERKKRNYRIKRGKICGAKRKYDGQPCEMKPIKKGGRCKFHGGMSTGPRTPEGKARFAEFHRQRMLKLWAEKKAAMAVEGA